MPGRSNTQKSMGDGVCVCRGESGMFDGGSSGMAGGEGDGFFSEGQIFLFCILFMPLDYRKPGLSVCWTLKGVFSV